MPLSPIPIVASNEPEKTDVPIKELVPIIREPEPVPIQPSTTVRKPEPEVQRQQPEVERKPEVQTPPPATVEAKKPEIVPESKKDFEKPVDSKKDFDIPGNSKPGIEFDMDGDVGRWRTDDQVKELVIYRYEWKEWPEDVPVDTGLQSYYELRYFKGGTNRKGESYADLYGKHRAKRDLWIDEYTAEQATVHAQVDAPTSKSNVVPLRRSGTSN